MSHSCPHLRDVTYITQSLKETFCKNQSMVWIWFATTLSNQSPLVSLSSITLKRNQGPLGAFCSQKKKKKQINKTKSVAIRYSKDNTKHLPALTWASEFRCFVFLKGDARHEVWSFSSFIVYQYKQVSTIHCHRSCSLLLNTCQYSTV